MDRDNAKEAVREATDIVALISQYTTLQPAGKRMKGLSPFTKEKTPSFFVDPDTGLYYCFSSQKGGDVFTFVQEMEGLDFKEALTMLAERSGIDLSTARGRNEQHAHLYHILEMAATEYRTHLTGTVREYVRSRGLTEETMERWGIGYAPDAWDTLCSAAAPDLNSRVQSGMCIRKDGRAYDRFRNRIMFPFHDTRGRIIGFSGRDCGDSGGAKYINSPESPLFHKSSFLYGLHLAKKHIRKSNFSILTEGPIDAIMVHQAGYPTAVAVSGTGVTENHIRQLQQLSDRLLIAFDGDQAGIRAAIRVIGMALEIGMDVKVLTLNDGTDPASAVKQDAEQFRQSVREAPHAVRFILRHVREKYGDTNEDMYRGVREEVLPIIARAKTPLARDYMIRETASFSSLGADAIAEEVGGILERRKNTPNRTERPPARTEPALPKPRKNLTDRIADLYIIASRARQFLFLHNVTLPEETRTLIDGIATEYGTIQEYDEGLAKLYFEEQAADDTGRIERARNELTDALHHLRDAVKKQGILKESKDTHEAKDGEVSGSVSPESHTDGEAPEPPKPAPHPDGETPPDGRTGNTPDAEIPTAEPVPRET